VVSTRFEKYAQVKLDPFPHKSGVENKKIFELPPPKKPYELPGFLTAGPKKKDLLSKK